jgi:hypothetical protein
MIAGIGGELASDNGPGLIVDQRRMLARVELILVRNLNGEGVGWCSWRQ